MLFLNIILQENVNEDGFDLFPEKYSYINIILNRQWYYKKLRVIALSGNSLYDNLIEAIVLTNMSDGAAF